MAGYIPPGVQGPAGAQYPAPWVMPTATSGGQAQNSMVTGAGTEAPQRFASAAPPTNALAPPTPPGAPAGPDYLSAFNQSLGASRAAIQSQLQGALGDIAHSQGLANQAIGLMPGQINALYGQAQGQMNSDANFLQDTLNQSGALSGFKMPSQQGFMEPVQAALANTNAYNLAEVPLLQLGANDSFAKLRSQANNAAIGAQESLNSEDRNALASMAQSQMQDQFNQQQAAMQNQYALGQGSANTANQLALYQSEQGAQSPYLTTDAGNYSQAQMLAQELGVALAGKGDSKQGTDLASVQQKIAALRARDPGAVAAALGGVKIG